MAAQPVPGNYCASGAAGPIYTAGAPGTATNAIQTLTLDATGGTFALGYEGLRTAAITWSNVNATLLAAINTALNALPNLGTSWVVATAGTLTAGVGTILLTFSGGDVAGRPVSLMTVANNSLTGTATASIASTTAGVAATGKGAAKGTLLIDGTNGTLYQNTGTAAAPVWTAR